MKRLFISFIGVCFLSACASSSDKISAKYVSPLQYSDFSCKQIRMEMMRVSRKVQEVSGHQDKEASGDAVALGVGLVLFWPALFFMIGDDKKDELGRLKGEYEALEQAAIQKNCDVSKEIEAARAQEAARKSSQQDGVKKSGAVNE